jgi:hypothetical protein
MSLVESGKEKDVIFLQGKNKFHLRLYHENMRYFERKERFVRSCVPSRAVPDVQSCSC